MREKKREKHKSWWFVWFSVFVDAIHALHQLDFTVFSIGFAKVCMCMYLVYKIHIYRHGNNTNKTIHIWSELIALTAHKYKCWNSVGFETIILLDNKHKRAHIHIFDNKLLIFSFCTLSLTIIWVIHALSCDV